MKIGFLVNDVITEKMGFTTVRLACEAVNQGHQIYYFGIGDIGRDQVQDYAARKNQPLSETERWLAPNLAY